MGTSSARRLPQRNPREAPEQTPPTDDTFDYLTQHLDCALLLSKTLPVPALTYLIELALLEAADQSGKTARKKRAATDDRIAR